MPAVAASAHGLSARARALALLEAVLMHKRPLDEALEPRGGAGLDERDRAFAQRLVLTTLRRLGQIDDLIGRCLERPLPAKAARALSILRLGAAQLAFLGTPDHAAVATALALAQGHRAGGYKALINAVLRRIAREHALWQGEQDAARLNTPAWLWRSWSDAHGEPTTRAIADAHLAEPPLDLSSRAADALDLAKRLGGEVLSTGSVRLWPSGPIGALPGYDQGAWWVQDAAAALPARLLGRVAGQTVIDLCAAPGGKTLQLAAAGATVISVDHSPKRLSRLRQNLQRVALDATLVEADATTWRPDRPAGLVLLDPPCTATGTIRRHPDIAHLKSPDDVLRAVAVQDQLLANALAMVAPGGTLVYAVCSLQPEEGPDRIAALLARDTEFAIAAIAPAEIGDADLVAPDGTLRTLPSYWPRRGGMDGFYAARLRRIRP